MGRLILTNSNDYCDKLENIYKETGFKQNGQIDDDILNVRTFSKLNVNTYNLYQVNDDFVATSGTMMHKSGGIGEECLKKIWFSLESGEGINEIRSHLCGMYVCAVKKENVLKVFVDESNEYAFYYFCKGDKWIVTNTYYHVEKCVQEPVDDNSLLEILQQG